MLQKSDYVALQLLLHKALTMPREYNPREAEAVILPCCEPVTPHRLTSCSLRGAC